MKSLLAILTFVFMSFFAYAQVMNYETFATYLYDVSEGTIFSNAPVDTSLQFRIDQKKKIAYALLEDPDIDLIHSLFSTDITKMIQLYHTSDFITAKKIFYQNQSYSSRKMEYSRAYAYPSDWHSLFHPPIRSLLFPFVTYGEQFEPVDRQILFAGPFFKPEFHRKLDQLTNTEMTTENELQLLSNGENSFREKMRMIKQTKKFFFSVVMVEYCDETGSIFATELFKKVKEGVDVRLIVESVWSKLLLQSCLDKLKEGGVKIILSNGFFQPDTLFTVMHDKFWIRDGEEGIIGGQNMHDFENLSNGFNGHTRDRDVLIKSGPAVTDLLREYIKLWNYFREAPDPSLIPYTHLVERKMQEERKKKLRGTPYYQDWLEQSEHKANGLCRVIVQGSQTGRDLISKAYLEIIRSVQFSMFIDTLSLRFKEKKQPESYNTQIAKAIIEKGKEGVKIDIISNGLDAEMGDTGHHLKELARKLRKMKKFILAAKVDHLVKKLAYFYAKPNHKALAKLTKNPNIDGWEYFNHIHSKQIIFDQILTSTGSFNLDKYSFKNHEATMICLDEKLANESLEGFVYDIINSIPVRK